MVGFSRELLSLNLKFRFCALPIFDCPRTYGVVVAYYQIGAVDQVCPSPDLALEKVSCPILYSTVVWSTD